MDKEIIYSMSAGVREDFEITGYRFGKGGKSACIVGAMRGNEYQQLYIASQLIDALRELEAKGAINANHEILVIPCINQRSMNIGKRNWVRNHEDINRQFPGNPEGEETSRVAAKIMESVKDYNYGIQFSSSYMEGEFAPHVRMMETGQQNNGLANLFGLPYVMTSQARPFDTRTLNYNWQLNGASAFSIYTSVTNYINEPLARQAVSCVLRFLTRMGIIKYNCHNGYIASIFQEEELITVKSKTSGFIRKRKGIHDEVRRGDVLAEVVDPYEGNIIDEIISPSDGIIFFEQNSAMVFQHAAAFKIIKRLHE